MRELIVVDYGVWPAVWIKVRWAADVAPGYAFRVIIGASPKSGTEHYHDDTPR